MIDECLLDVAQGEEGLPVAFEVELPGGNILHAEDGIDGGGKSMS